MNIRTFKIAKSCRDDSRTARACQIVEYAHESAESLHDAFVHLKGGRKGPATDEEQDVLRAMLVFAGAGLDSSIKELFKSCLRHLVLVEPKVKDEFQKFIQREISKGTAQLPINTKLLAEAFVEPFPIIYLIERYVYDLTGSSLQSADQIFSASAALGIDPKKEAKLDKDKLDRIFKARNKIIHEFDIDFSGARRNRVLRPMTKMIERTNVLLEVSERFIKLVHSKLPDEG